MPVIRCARCDLETFAPLSDLNGQPCPNCGSVEFAAVAGRSGNGKPASPPPFWTATARHGSVEVVNLGGELDLATVDAAAEAIRARGSRSGLVVDLSHCSFIDSSGIALLLRSCEECRQAGVGFAVAGVRDQPRRVFDLVCAEMIIGVFASTPTALEALSERLGGASPPPAVAPAP